MNSDNREASASGASGGESAFGNVAMSAVAADSSAQTFWDRFRATQNIDDLAAAVEYGRESIRRRGPSDPEQARAYGRLGLLLAPLHRHTADPRYLSEQIESLNVALARVPASDPMYHEFESTLSTALSYRHALSGSREDADAAVDHARRALSIAQDIDDAQLDEFNLRMGAALVDRFLSVGTDADLDDAVIYMRAAVQIGEERGRQVSGRLADLGRTLTTRFHRWGRVEDLEEATRVYRRALEELPPQHPDLASHLSGLGGVLELRYSRYGRTSDLDEAIKFLREAIGLTPDQPVRHTRAGRLSSALEARYGRHGDPSDLSEAIDLLEWSLNSDIPDFSSKAAAQVALAGLFRTRAAFGGRQDLELARDLLVAALTGTSRADPNYPHLIGNIAVIDGDLYATTGEVEHLSPAVAGIRSALRLSPSDSTYRPTTQLLLAQLLLMVAEADPDQAENARSEALRNARDAANHAGASPTLSCLAATLWAELAQNRERLAAYERALELLPLVTPSGLEVADSLVRLSGFSALASNAAAAYIEAGDLERAIEVLEQGRAVSLNMKLRWRSDTSRLRRINPTLANEYENVLSMINGASDAGPIEVAGETSLDQVVDRIRRLPGFASFGEHRRARDLLASLPQGSFVYINVATDRCDAVILEQGSARLVPLVDLTIENAAANATRFLRSMDAAVRAQTANEIEDAEEEAREVTAWLWDHVANPVLRELGLVEAPSLDDFSNWPRVWWIPTGPLAMVPMHAAGHHAAFTELGKRESQSVLDRAVSTTLPSMEAVLSADAAPSPLGPAAQMLVVAVANADGEEPLPGVIDEVEEIIAHVGTSGVVILADAPELKPNAAATRANVLAAVGSANWLHFACHAVHTPSEPTESYLVLSDHLQQPFRVDDLIRARPAAPRLAFFSACSTARIAVASIDEPTHFGTAAMMAGFAHAITTLWPVFDDPEVASSIYEQLLRMNRAPLDAPSAVALHSTTHKLRNRYNALHRWAAYVHLGA